MLENIIVLLETTLFDVDNPPQLMISSLKRLGLQWLPNHWQRRHIS